MVKFGLLPSLQFCLAYKRASEEFAKEIYEEIQRLLKKELITGK